jgi:CHAT domain-containing protein
VLGYNGADLHYAEAEARAIAHLIGASTLVGKDATRTAVLQEAPGKRWVHFSCHGRFNAHAPLTSHLLLADGPLYAADILQELQLQAELVTLSACETGRSQVLKGDELIGLARAFIYAGTPSVLVSLWPVDELSTRILMERFYQGLLAGQSKAAALRTAQQTLRNLTVPEVEAILAGYGASDPARQVERLRNLTSDDRVFAHPYFWAPFMLVGDQLGPPPGS